MEKDKIFFGEAGLTSTSANHLCNLSKEMYKALDTTLNKMVLYTTKVKLISSSDESLINEGWNDDKVQKIPEYLNFIANLKSLIAWCREAISAKERLIKEADHYSYQDFDLEVPDAPVRQQPITQDDVIGSWNIKKRNRYYYLEALCATIGQAIHPDGSFSMERDQLNDVLSKPREVSGSGRDTVIYTRTPSCMPATVDEVFMKLQNTYRGYQAELNSMKHEVETTINNDAVAKNAKYAEEITIYNGKMEAINAEMVKLKKEAVIKAQNLKIVIPDSLKAVYDSVNSQGK